ncbi:MAG TPA: PaaI family thioesterase [Candidatus Gallacutalibacter stercoravium]|nr:PaaI family thioesterase [Candidatus Gallacutalibacter stercoravium]
MKIISKQNNSRMCVICGLDNPFGVQAPFYVMEDNSVMTQFSYRAEHQSYPGRVHGGLITAMLDELGFRAYWAIEPEVLAVTTVLETKYRRPVPYGVPLKGRGVIVSASSRFVKSNAELVDMDGNVLAQAEIKYIKLPTEQVTDADYHEEMCYAVPDGRQEL